MFKEGDIETYNVGVSGISEEIATDTDIEQLILEGQKLTIEDLNKINDEKIRNILIANIEKIKEIDLNSIQEEQIPRDGTGYYIINEDDCRNLEAEFIEEGCDVRNIEKGDREVGLIVEKDDEKIVFVFAKDGSEEKEKN